MAKVHEDYFDKNGKKIEAGMTLRHEDGDTDMVHQSDDGDLGFNATNEQWKGHVPGYSIQLYPLYQFNLHEWEIVRCERCEAPSKTLRVKSTSNGYAICGECWIDGEDRE